MAIVEVCGFNDWLLKLLAEYGCREMILIQPEKRSKKKTDRRDANALGEVLWVNRAAALGGQAGPGMRRVQPPTARGRRPPAHRLRKRLGQLRTRTINEIKHLLRKHNLEQECPTKGLDTITGKRAATLRWAHGPAGNGPPGAVEAVGRADQQLEADPATSGGEQTAAVIATIPGCGAYSSLALASRIGASTDSRGRQPGQLLGPDAGLPQLGRGDRPARLDHQARQRHGPLHPRAVGAARLAA